MSEALPPPRFERAKLIPFRGEQPDTDESTHIRVLFNPVSLRVSLQNQMKTEAGANGGRERASQYVESSSSTLTVELLFDTTVASPGVEANSDVRILTGTIATTFMKPQGEGERKDPPKKLQFSWGSFLFNGVVTSYSETIDFFAPEGIPLRATLSLTISEDSFQYERDPDVVAAQRAQPQFSSVPEQQSLSQNMNEQGKDPRDWRREALFNGMESPRLSAGLSMGAALGASVEASVGLAAEVEAGVSVGAGISLSAGAAVEANARAQLETGAGVAFGASSSLGTSIPGAFSVPKGGVTCRW